MTSADAITPHPANVGARLGPKRSAVLSSSIGGTIYGLSAGIISGLSDPIVKGEFFAHKSKSDQSLFAGVLTACVLLGAFGGCFAGVWAGNRFGRRVAFRITGLLCVVMSVLLAVVPGFALIVISRTLLGVSVGFATALCPWYVTEAVPSNVRGSIGTLFQINICASILAAQVINWLFHPDASETNVFLDEWKWRLQFALSALPGAALALLSFFMHESPAYLQQLDEQSRLAMRGQHMALPVEDNVDPGSMAASDSNLAMASGVKLGWGDLFSRRYLRYVGIGLILASSNQLTGINAIMFYSPKIFTDAGLSNPLVLAFAVVGSWNLLSVFISFALVDRLGRRPLMLGALCLMFCGAGLMSLAYEAWPSHKSVPAILAMLLFVGGFECGPGPLFFPMSSESFPPALRDVAMSFTQSSVWVCSILVTFGFPVLNDSLGPAATFFIFTLLCAVGGVLIWAFVPEPASDKDVDAQVQIESNTERPAARARAGSGYTAL